MSEQYVMSEPYVMSEQFVFIVMSEQFVSIVFTVMRCLMCLSVYCDVSIVMSEQFLYT
jgi:hypothetical protein